MTDGRTGLVAKLSAVMAEVVGVVKSHETESGPRYKYVATNDFVEVVRPVLVRHGVVLVPSLQEVTERSVAGKGGVIALTTARVLVTVLDSETGDSLEFLTVGEAMDSGDKALSKAVTSAMGSALRWLFLIPTCDEGAGAPPGVVPPPDVDPATGEVAGLSEGQLKFLRGLMSEVGVDEADVCRRAEVDGLELLPRQLYFAKVLPWLKGKKG